MWLLAREKSGVELWKTHAWCFVTVRENEVVVRVSANLERMVVGRFLVPVVTGLCPDVRLPGPVWGGVARSEVATGIGAGDL